MDDRILVPAEFWRRITDQEMHQVLFERDGRLSAKQCKLLWRLLKRTDKPPESFVLEADGELARCLALLKQMRASLN